MTTPIMLDTGPLGKITHPRRNPDIVNWFQSLLQNNVPVIIPEISDYELRRNLILENLIKSLERLNQLKELLIYQPINTDTMLLAAQLWADARKNGTPTANKFALDGDVILSTQAIQSNAVIVTENTSHLSQFTLAIHWNEL
jgi:predicted nucleic acid-binding protein